jgi:trehalose utilization protein
MIRVTIWNEYYFEKVNDIVAQHYPSGIHNAIAGIFESDNRFSVKTATLGDADSGLSEETLQNTDVLIWWGHKKHAEVPDEAAKRVQARVLEGMGFIALHSSHLSKPFLSLMGTSCTLKWRTTGEKERLWNIAPYHPIAKDLGEYFELEKSEMYGERFDIPEPEKTIFISWFKGGEVFRSGCTWMRGNGKIFYFAPGHETFPIFLNSEIRKVILNATIWAAAVVKIPATCPNVEPMESLDI